MLLSQSVVLHELSVDNVVSTFPISLGTRISGVDDNTFTSTGENFSMVGKKCSSRTLQRTVLRLEQRHGT
jgi:endonuclease V-like protein UPF0215 family